MLALNPLIAYATDSSKPFGLSSHFESVLADFLEEALLAKSRDRSIEIAGFIQKLLNKCIGESNTEVNSLVVSSEDARSDLREAYLLGQLSLAQLVTATHINKKVCSKFLAAVADETNRKYIKALIGGEQSNQAVAEAVNHSEEHTSRKLRELREIGIVESRRMGKRSMNFLTAATLGVMSEFGEHSPNQSEEAVVVFELANSVLSPIMRNHTPLGRRKAA